MNVFSRLTPEAQGLGMTGQRARDRLIARLKEEGIADRREALHRPALGVAERCARREHGQGPARSASKCRRWSLAAWWPKGPAIRACRMQP